MGRIDLMMMMICEGHVWSQGIHASFIDTKSLGLTQGVNL